MKTFFYIIGGVVCVGLIIVAMYVAMTIGISVYIAKTNNMRAAARAAAERAAEQVQMQRSIDLLGRNSGPEVEKQRDEDEMAGKAPSLFADPEGYDTEDNWLATQISREIAEMAFFAPQPGVTLPDLKVKARFDPVPMQVKVEIEGWSAGVTTSELTPAFAWDPNGYAPLAQKLVGTTPGVADEPELADNNVLANLLELTGPKLAMEDVQLSENLQAHPASWQDHEAAALLLVALALRNEDSQYADNRPLLCKAVAHLALAQAWRGSAHATWAGLIAGAAIRTIAGREMDALAHLDNLGAQPDVPDEARPWIAALRVLATQDWRKADVTDKSPLLLKITWFRILEKDLLNDVPTDHLKQVVPQPAADPTAPADQQKTNPETLVPDWGRIAGKSPFYDESDDNVKNAEYRMDLEFHELDEILKTEQADAFDVDHLATVFAGGTTDSVTADANGKTTLRVIGPGNFKADTLGHVFDGLISQEMDAAQGQDSAQAQNLFAKTESLFKDVPGYELARTHLGFVEATELQKEYAAWIAAGKTYPVWYAGYDLETVTPGFARIKAFYRNVVPFGTAYEADRRAQFLPGRDPSTIPPYDTAELEKLKKLPIDKAIPAINDYNKRYNTMLAKSEPSGPSPQGEALLKLDPDDYDLVAGGLPPDQLKTAAARFLDYNMKPIEGIESLDADHLSDADRIEILRKHVALEPAFGFRAGVVLRSKGLVDEAAEMDRKAFATKYDLIGVAESSLPLVDYDLAHGRTDEALEVATYAGQANTIVGLSIYGYALEKLGKLDEAEAVAKRQSEMYTDNSWLLTFQLRHPDRYPQVYKETLDRAFPNGLVRAKLADFTAPPKQGDKIITDSDTLRGAGLQLWDVIVALDGYRVETDDQYYFVRALSNDSKMDFIVWRDGKYLEMTASVPARRLLVDMADYHGS